MFLLDDALKDVSIREILDLLVLLITQTLALTHKHFVQKLTGYSRRKFLGDVILTPFFVAGMMGALTAFFVSVSQQPPADYARTQLANINQLFDPQEGKAVLFYTPNNHAGVNAMMDAFQKEFQSSISVRGTIDTESYTLLYQKQLYDVWGALDFTLSEAQVKSGKLVVDKNATASSSGSVIDYTIRLNSQFNFYVQPVVFDQQVYNQVRGKGEVWNSSGYLSIHNWVSSYIVREYNHVGNAENFQITPYVQRYPKSKIYPESMSLDFEYGRYEIWRFTGPIFLVIALLYPVVELMSGMVSDRENKMRDLLEISGLMPVAYAYSHYLTGFILLCIAMVMICLILVACQIIHSTTLMAYVSLMIMYGIASPPFLACLGFVFNKSSSFGMPVFILHAGLAVAGIYTAHAYQDVSLEAKLFLSFLLPPIGISVGVFGIEQWAWDNPSVDDPVQFSFVYTNEAFPSLSNILGIFVLSHMVYSFIAWGMPFDWLFARGANADKIAMIMEAHKYHFPTDFEDQDTSHTCGVQDDENGCGEDENVFNIQNISHVYPNNFHALQDLSLSVKKGEILSFLGANGAGKSTTMSILAGIITPTVGDAKIGGYSIRGQKTLARGKLGICMQQDILWPDLSVSFHLRFFGRLRGLYGTSLNAAVDTMLADLGFPEKRDALTRTLSGGQKRRLCVGISMIGNNPAVFLDEPTAGLDPVSRRQLWELIQKNKKGRAILLTTHFMDEADVLGDRVAIIKKGRMRAMGTAAFLKATFGVGYFLRLSLQEGATSSDRENICKHIQEFVSEAELVSDAGNELALRIPKEATARFPGLFRSLDESSAELKINSYGIETTSLEEVFMHISFENTDPKRLSQEDSSRSLGSTGEIVADNLKSEIKELDEDLPILQHELDALLVKGNQYTNSRFFHVLRILITKRLLTFVRSKEQIVLGVLVPLILSIIGGLIIHTFPTKLISPLPPIKYGYGSVFNTPVSGPSSSVVAWGHEAFSETDDNNIAQDYWAPTLPVKNNPVYVEGGYHGLFRFLDSNGATPPSNISAGAIAYETVTNFTVLFNDSYPLYFPGLVQDAIDAAAFFSTGGLMETKVQCLPMPVNISAGQAFMSLFFCMIMALSSATINSGNAVILCKERISNVKHLQLASGTSRFSYHLANFLFDFAVMYLNVLILAVILVIFVPSSFAHSPGGGVDPSGFQIVMYIGIPYAAIVTFKSYLMSLYLSTPNMIQVVFILGSLVSAFFCMFLYLEALGSPNIDYNIASPGAIELGFYMSIVEPNLGFTILIILQSNFLGGRTFNNCNNVLSETLGGGAILGIMVAMAIVWGIAFSLLEFQNACCANNSFGLLCHFVFGRRDNHIERGYSIPGITDDDQHSVMVHDNDDVAALSLELHATNMNENEAFVGKSQRLSRHSNTDLMTGMDLDVLKECMRVDRIVNDSPADNTNMGIKLDDTAAHTVLFDRVQKSYPPLGMVPGKVAVKGVDLVVGKGEIFGLLGANGAGKTTLLKIATGQENQSSGNVYVDGYSTMFQRHAAQRSMGLCPQFDTLVEALSVRENLHMFAYMKGIQPRQIRNVCESFMVALNIKMYERNLIQELSGGTRRKVSLAVALLGNPPSLYLDEPSTGLDPIACRYMWRLLSKLSSTRNSAMILTTHNMLECQAVCSRIGIMKQGELVALGDSQHLRRVHGAGYMLEIICTSQDEDKINNILAFVSETFPGAVITDRHNAMINYDIPREVVPALSEAFARMEQNEQRLFISDYSLSQSTLEQVFMKAIQMTPTDLQNYDKQSERVKAAEPTCMDYFLGVITWILGIVPFFTCCFHCMLGNFLTACVRFWTLNWFYIGCLMDGTVLNLLIQDAVHAKGHLTCHVWDCCSFVCRCCACFWCCCCRYGCCASTKTSTYPMPQRNRMQAGGGGSAGSPPLNPIVTVQPHSSNHNLDTNINTHSNTNPNPNSSINDV